MPNIPTIPVPLGGGGDRRSAERLEATMPMQVNGRRAVTENLSADGLAFECEERHQPGTMIDVVIEYLLDGHNYPLHCRAQVVRVEPRATGGFLVAARLRAEPAGAVHDTAGGGAGTRQLRPVP